MGDDILYLGEVIQDILYDGVEECIDLTKEEHYRTAELIITLAEEIEKVMYKRG